MQVASILTSNKDIVSLFQYYVMNYRYLILTGEHEDTYYFVNKNGDRGHEIYLHMDSDLEEEGDSNFSESGMAYIRQYFKGHTIYLVDVSFRDRVFFTKMLSDFIKYLLDHNKADVSDILIDDPIKGIIRIDHDGQLPELGI